MSTSSTENKTETAGRDFLLGLDLGQAQDHTALAALQPVDPPEGTRRQGYHLREIRRFELGTRYPAIVEQVTGLMQRPELGKATLIIDATGVGRPIVELFEKAGLRPVSIWITGGDSVNRSGREWRVPKRELASVLQALLQSSRLKFARELRWAEALREELSTFRAKINIDTGHASFEHWRERDKDDMVLALAMACWYAERMADRTGGGAFTGWRDGGSDPRVAGFDEPAGFEAYYPLASWH